MEQCIVGWPQAGHIRASTFCCFLFFFHDLVLVPKIPFGFLSNLNGSCGVWVDSKKGRRPPLRPFAALPRSGQHHPSAPPAHNNSRASGTSQEVWVVGLLCSFTQRPPPHARTTPLPFPFPFSPSPSLPSLTHRQLISRLRDLPFFLTLYSLTLPAFSGYSLTLSAVLDALFWHPFTLVVPCSRHHPTFHDVPPRHSTRHSLSKSTLNSPQLVDGISTFFGLHHFFLAFIIIILHSVLFPVWGFLYTKENTCLSDPLNFHVSDRREVLHDH